MSGHKVGQSDRVKKVPLAPAGESTPPSGGSKESRRLQQLVQARVASVFTDASHDEDLSELVAPVGSHPRQPPITRVIPVPLTSAPSQAVLLESPQSGGEPAVAPAPTPVLSPVVAAPHSLPSEPLANGMHEIPIDRIVPSPYQPRVQVHEEADGELAESVRSSGLLQPILVRPLASGFFELVAGERRWRASKQAGHTSIVGLVRSVSDEEAALNALVENLQRVNLGPLELARAYDKTLKTFQLEQEELARRLGISVSQIKHAVRVLALPASILEQVLAPETGLGLSHAAELLALKDQPDRLARVVRDLLSEHWSVDRLRAEIGRTPRINRGAQAVHFEDRGDKGFRMSIRFQTNRPQDFPEILRQLELAVERVKSSSRARP